MFMLQATPETVSIWSWVFDPVVIGGLYLVGFLYYMAISRRRLRWFPDSEPVSRGRVVAFYLGLTTILLAIISPLEPLADDYLLSAHMVQHIMLTLIAPPLVIAGIPAWMIDPIRRRERIWRVWRVLTLPIVAFLLFHLPFTLSHVPVFYDLTLQNRVVHIFEHYVYMSTAFLAWWPVVAPGPVYGQLQPGARMLYLFVQTLPGQVVGALITGSERVLYPTYENAPRVWGLTAVVDQQVGGMIMWIAVASFYLGAVGVVFFRWASSEDRDQRRRYEVSANRPAPPRSPVP